MTKYECRAVGGSVCSVGGCPKCLPEWYADGRDASDPVGPPGPTVDPFTDHSRSAVIAEAVLADSVRVERPALPTDSSERKRTPLCTGCLDYFSGALQAVVDVIAEPWNTPVERDAESAVNVMYLLARRDHPHALASLALLALCELADELEPESYYDWPRVRTLSDLFDVFAGALAAVAQVSWHGNEKHNPGQPLHHARGKSMDHFDCIARHYVERGGFDGPMRHSACLAWRSLAALQEDLESKGAPKARGAK